MRRSAWVLVVCVACDAETEQDVVEQLPASEAPETESGEGNGEADSACGDTHLVDMEISGQLLDGLGKPVYDAEVWVEQRNWGPTVIHGVGLTDPFGRFAFSVEQLPIVEGCWGIWPQFFAVADSGDHVGELGLNMPFVLAWQNVTFLIDLSGLRFVADLTQPL